MPEYSFNCEKCEADFSKVWSMSEYDTKKKNVKCPECNSQRVLRDYSEDRVVTNYVKGLHECETLGEYADKQTKKLGKDKVESMRRDFVTKKREDTGMKELPSGMTRAKNTGMSAPLTKKTAKAKRGKKKK